jgi:hypothetical protein
MSNSLQFLRKGKGRKAKRPHLSDAAFSKTWLIYLISVVVGHGAPHRRHGGDGGRRRGRWSG